MLRDITYATLTGGTNAATLITPLAKPPARRAPAVLFVHWYGPPAPTSNRTPVHPGRASRSRVRA